MERIFRIFRGESETDGMPPTKKARKSIAGVEATPFECHDDHFHDCREGDLIPGVEAAEEPAAESPMDAPTFTIADESDVMAGEEDATFEPAEEPKATDAPMDTPTDADESDLKMLATRTATNLTKPVHDAVTTETPTAFLLGAGLTKDQANRIIDVAEVATMEDLCLMDEHMVSKVAKEVGLKLIPAKKLSNAIKELCKKMDGEGGDGTAMPPTSTLADEGHLNMPATRTTTNTPSNNNKPEKKPAKKRVDKRPKIDTQLLAEALFPEPIVYSEKKEIENHCKDFFKKIYYWDAALCTSALAWNKQPGRHNPDLESNQVCIKFAEYKVPEKNKIGTRCVHFYCKKCRNNGNILSLLASGRLHFDSPSKNWSFTMKHVFYHDRFCDMPEDDRPTSNLQLNQSGPGWILLNFPCKELLSSDYDKLKDRFEQDYKWTRPSWQKRNRTTIPDGGLQGLQTRLQEQANAPPPAENRTANTAAQQPPATTKPDLQNWLTKRGWDHLLPGYFVDFDGTYEFDDWAFCPLNDPSSHVKYPELNRAKHEANELKIHHFLANRLNRSKEFARYVPDYNENARNDDRVNYYGDHCVRMKKNPTYHLHIADTALLFGGHNMGEDGDHHIHQICHNDGEAGGKLCDNDALQDLTFPGSWILPLQDDRTIYVRQSNSRVTAKKGQILFYFADLPHGGVTWNGEDDPSWHLCLYGHLDSMHHERLNNEVHYHGSMEYYLPVEHVALLQKSDVRPITNYLDKAMSDLLHLVALNDWNVTDFFPQAYAWSQDYARPDGDGRDIPMAGNDPRNNNNRGDGHAFALGDGTSTAAPPSRVGKPKDPRDY